MKRTNLFKGKGLIILICSALALLILLFALLHHRHTYGEWQVSKEASCKEAGIQIRYCSCGKSQTASINKLEHTPGEWVTDQASMTRTLSCMTCGIIIITEDHEHTWTEWQAEREASCTSQGTEFRTCECGARDERNIDPLPHSFGNWSILREASCESGGIIERVCHCGKKETQKTDPLGHADSLYYVENGSVYYYCPRCLKILKTEILRPSTTFKVEDGRIVGVENFSGGQLIIPSEYAGKTITEIGEEAFMDMKEITSVVLPSTVTIIGDKAFYGCSELKTINLENIKAIGKISFGYCEDLNDIHLGTGLESIGTWAFEYCASLDRITYHGSREQWDSVSKGKKWDLGTPSEGSVIFSN